VGMELNQSEQEDSSLRFIRTAGMIGAVVGLAVGEAINFTPPVEMNTVNRFLTDGAAMVINGVGAMIVTAVRTMSSHNRN